MAESLPCGLGWDSFNFKRRYTLAYMGDKTDVTLTLEERHKDWAQENRINLSGWVRDRIDEEMQS